MSNSIMARSLTALALGGVLIAVAPAAPASAQGFFDQLFGGGTVQPQQPTYSYQPQQPMSPDIGHDSTVRSRPRAKKAIVAHLDAVPQQRQRTTDLWHDKTLRPGDAIMMKDGLHVYNGPQAPKHNARQFVRLDAARHVSGKERSALVAMDTTRNDPLRSGEASNTGLASGRSAAVSTPVSKGFRITDARGASIRYVGP